MIKKCEHPHVCFLRTNPDCSMSILYFFPGYFHPRKLRPSLDQTKQIQHQSDGASERAAVHVNFLGSSCVSPKFTKGSHRYPNMQRD
jgi:hypothetical protein